MGICFTKNNRRKIKNDDLNTQSNNEEHLGTISNEIISQNNDENISQNNVQNIPQNIAQNNDEISGFESPEVLELIINSLIDDKKNLLKKMKEKNLNTKQYEDNYNNITDYGNPKSPQEYQLIIDKLLKEVTELENIIKTNKLENQNNDNQKTQISFNYSSGGKYLVDVENETKLGDAFRKTDLFNQGCNIEKMLFLYGGKNVTQNFRRNDTVSSINNNSFSSLSIIVRPIN